MAGSLSVPYNIWLVFILIGMLTAFAFAGSQILSCVEEIFQLLIWPFRLLIDFDRKLHNFHGHGRARSNGKARRDYSQTMTREELQRLIKTSSNKSFRPWRRDYLKAALFFALALVFIGGALSRYRQELARVWAAAGMISIFPLFLAVSYYERGQKRKYGKRIEAAAIRECIEALP